MQSIPYVSSRSTTNTLRILCLVLRGLAATRAQTQQPDQQQPTPQQQAPRSPSPREVLLDVVVTDADGHPVTGLKLSDFTLREENTPQQIHRVEEHYPMTPDELAKLQSAPALPASTFFNGTTIRNTNFVTVLFLDAMDTPIDAQMNLHEQLVEYLKHMEPGATIAIFLLDTELRLVQGFTANQQMLLNAAKSKRGMPSLNKPIYGTPSQYRRARMDLLRASMREISRYLSGYPGRKNLISLTGANFLTILGSGFGYPFQDNLSVIPTDSTATWQDDPTGQRNLDDMTLSDFTDELRISRVAVYPVNTRGTIISAMQLGTAPPTEILFNASFAPSNKIERITNRRAVKIEHPVRTGYPYYMMQGLTQLAYCCCRL